VEAFNGRLRDQINLDTLCVELLATDEHAVSHTGMTPACHAVSGSSPPQVRAPAPAHQSPSSDRDCPLDTAGDRCLWHAGGTAGENHDRSTGARPLTWAIGCAGRSGDPDIKPAPAPATTHDKPLDHGDHDLRLQC
jgi:hypothetical protein